MLANRNPSCLNLPYEKSLAYQSVDQPLIVIKNVKIFCVSFVFFFFGYNTVNPVLVATSVKQATYLKRPVF